MPIKNPLLKKEGTQSVAKCSTQSSNLRLVHHRSGSDCSKDWLLFKDCWIHKEIGLSNGLKKSTGTKRIFQRMYEEGQFYREGKSLSDLET